MHGPMNIKYVHMVGSDTASPYNAPTFTSQKVLGRSGQSEKYRQQSVSRRPLNAEARI